MIRSMHYSAIKGSQGEQCDASIATVRYNYLLLATATYTGPEWLIITLNIFKQKIFD